MMGSFFKNKKGIAIESAIFTMLMVFALCTIIVTVSMYMIKGIKEENQAFSETVFIDQIGEDFLYAVEQGALYVKDDHPEDGDDSALVLTVPGENGESSVKKLFMPSAYCRRYDTERQKLYCTVSAPKNGVGQFVLTLKKDTTYVTEAVRDEDGNVIREESETVVNSHLLTVMVHAESVDGVMTYKLTHWSYLD